MKFLRLFSDQVGESHFDIAERSMSVVDAAPLTKPVFFTQAEPTTAWASVRCPSEWGGGLHLAPRRQILICTAESLRMTSSLGDRRDLLPGSVIFVEDVGAKGHVSEVTSSTPFEALVVSLE